MNKPSVVYNRSHAKQRVANECYFSPPPPSLRCTFGERAAVLTLTEQGRQSHWVQAGLISMALLCLLVCSLLQRLVAASAL